MVFSWLDRALQSAASGASPSTAWVGIGSLMARYAATVKSEPIRQLPYHPVIGSYMAIP